MSYEPRVAAWPYGAPDSDDDGGARKGSVRAARERLQASKIQGQKTDRSKIIGLPQRPNQLVSQFSAQQAARQQQTMTPSDDRGPTNASSPQWPLPNNADDVLDSRPGQFPRPPNRGPPPQRPPRPVSEEFLIQQPSPDYRASYQSDDMLSPASGPSRPLTTSSAASEASSLGSIPDFPVPQPPMPTIQPLPRRNPSLGPPPSSRRGPSSYYTQVSYVSPIVEEVETRSNTIQSHHGSFASSNVIPSNDDYYSEDGGMRSDDDETITSDYGRASPGSDHDDNSGLVTPALVRQASLGRRTKPSLMTIKSVDSLEKKGAFVKRKPMPGDAAMGAAGAVGIGGAVLAARDGIAGPRKGSFGNNNGFDPTLLSKNSLDSEKDLHFRFGDDPEKSGPGSPTHPLQQATRNASMGERAGKRPPLRIDVDAVREAEARGSLTSLPELIRRATRLAANLDRGKTASRLGLDFWESGAPDKNANRRSGSFGDMLAAFPPPGDATPNDPNTPNPKGMSKWPSEGYGTDSAVSDRKSNGRRRCCGMPMWTFVTLLIVLLFLIAAAVIIPIVLIVIPRMKNTTDAAQQTSGSGNSNNGDNNNNNNNNNPSETTAPTGGSNDQCSGIMTCQNGGVAILNADRSCNCVCINGFTGRTCATQGDAGCTTTSIAGTANNATVGSGIPRLIESAENQFSIPLDSTRILSLFSSLSLSCTAENALITFNGLASRSAARDYIPIIVDTSLTPSRSLPFLDEPHPDQGLRQLQERQAIGDPGVANTNAASSTATSEPSATPTPDQPISSNATALDFARLGVLMALQESGELDTAASAQESIQDFLTQDQNGNSNGNTVSVGPFTIDLVQLSIEFQNGTTIQATSNATASS